LFDVEYLATYGNLRPLLLVLEAATGQCIIRGKTQGKTQYNGRVSSGVEIVAECIQLHSFIPEFVEHNHHQCKFGRYKTGGADRLISLDIAHWEDWHH